MANLTTLLSLLILSLLSTTTLSIITDQGLTATIIALRSNGYHLFGNAIATSDLRFQLLSSPTTNSSFTLLSPLDSTLFTLDMAAPASTYIQTLRFHVIPRRLSFSDLRNNLSHVDTLLPHNSLLLNTENDNVFVNGVRISRPDLFLGPDIAVHGLDGMLVPDDLVFDTPANDFLSPDISPAVDSDSDSQAISPDILSPHFKSNRIAPTIAPSTELSSPQFPTLNSPPPEILSPQIPPQISPSPQFPTLNSPPLEILSPQIPPQTSPPPEYPSPQSLPPPKFLSPQFQPNLIFPPRSANLEIKNESSRIKNRGLRNGKTRRSHGRHRHGRHGHRLHGKISMINRHFSDV